MVKQSLCFLMQFKIKFHSTIIYQKEELVSTPTEDGEDGFDLSSPVRNTNHIFLHSPPSRVNSFFQSSKWTLPHKILMIFLFVTSKNAELETLYKKKHIEFHY